MWYVNYKMQNQFFQSYTKFMHGKIKKQIQFIYIYNYKKPLLKFFIQKMFLRSFLVKGINIKKIH